MTTRVSELDVESELSYAYLHAVASRAGMACCTESRLADKAGIDARLTAWRPEVSPGTYLREVDINVQLKSTRKIPADDGSHLSYFLKKQSRYDDLRAETVATPRILVVLFLPDKRDDWLSHDVEGLVLRKCAYWVSLRGAPPVSNRSGVTIKLPKSQTLDPDNLARLCQRLFTRDVPRYEESR